MCPDYFQLLLELRDRYSGPHHRNHAEEVISAVIQHLRRGLDREPDPLGYFRSHLFRKPEAQRHHPDDGHRLATDCDCLSHDAGVGMKHLPPDPFGENHHPWSTRKTLSFNKGPAEQGLRAKT